MFDAQKQGREREAYEQSQLDNRWGVNRRDADAFLMTQAMHTEKTLSELKGLVLLIAVGALAYVEGYHWAGWGAAFIGFGMVSLQETAFKRRHASISRLMDKNLD